MTASKGNPRPLYNPGKGEGTPVGIAVLGHGTVGAQVIRLINDYADELTERIGGPLEVKGIAVSDMEKHQDDVPADLLTDDAESLVTRDDVDLVVEVIGGIDYPRKLVLKALTSGKSVVTANKALVAAHWGELSEAAEAAKVDLFFEAAVAGAIPVVGPLIRSLAGDKVTRVMGIVNGTTNYILDGMDSQGASYEEMLAQATELGYAEADPTADVEGYDAASKAAILASLAFHTRVYAKDVYREGITKVTAADMAAAREAGYLIKLLAICERITDESGQEKVSARVHPTLIRDDHPLAGVRESFNAVFVEAEAAGRLMFYGRGAGGAPTASAVVGDIVAAARNRVFGGRAPGESSYANLPIADFGDVVTRFHVDMTVADRAGVLAEIASLFAKANISVSTLRQEEAPTDVPRQTGNRGGRARLVVVTHSAHEHDLEAVVEQLKGLEAVHAINSVLRLEA